ncbi:MAG TPA: penicillin-binding protein 2 [Solirubrobacteraceae bacterium]|nr:penicillin-binding protein 2 [Solirubrobacteraceae bacterium]
MQRRIGFLFAFFVFALLAAGVRTAYLGTLQGGKLSHAAASQQQTLVTVPAQRGLISDRTGVELAVSQPASDVAATPYLVRDPVAAGRALGPLLRQPADTLTAKLARRKTGFVYLARQVAAQRADQIRRLTIAGVQLIPTTSRTYPRGWLAAQVLGTVGIDGRGLSGLEYAHEGELGGHAGQRRVTSDALGHAIAIQQIHAERPGRPISLTLDATLQTRVEDVLSRVGRMYRPKGATAIVMDPRTNEILAMANWPRVDANDVSGAPSFARENRSIAFNYEPGSTFKAFTVAGALQEGVVTPQTNFDLAPEIKVADRTIGESHPRGAETLSTAQILAQSSNVGAITIGLRLGRARFDSWVRRFGFGRSTGVDLPGEERGQVLTLDKYSGSSMGNLPIGQGESVTPLQMATAYSAIANGGILRPAHVVRSVAGHPTAPPAGHRVIAPQVAAELRQMLKGVFAPGGTASEVSIRGYQLAGKTGTANKIDPSTGQYSKSRYIASFVGFAPARHPRLLTAVMVDEPQGAIYGGVVAAPAFGQIMSFGLSYLRIPPS